MNEKLRGSGKLRPQQIALQCPNLLTSVVAGDLAADLRIEVLRRRRGTLSDDVEAITEHQGAHSQCRAGKHIESFAGNLCVDMGRIEPRRVQVLCLDFGL